MSTEVGKLYVQFDADGRPYIQGLKDIDRHTQAFQRDQQTAFDKLGNKLGSAIKLGMAAGAAAVVAGGVLITKSLIKTAASYEYEMSRIKAVTKATETEMKAMGDMALKLGADTQFSAGEAAQGINELAKAGVAIADILGGGIQGTLALAAAGELEVSRAAEVASNAMNVFGLSGDQVIQVADALSSAANKSSLEVEDLAMSLQYIGPVAAQLKIPMEQVVAALAELGQVGIKGDMAGTGIRGMLNSLISPSSTARDAMADLGVEIADTAGNIKPLGGILDEFAEGLEGMTEADKMDALGKIFDTQQLGVAMELIKGGSKSLGTWTDAVSEQGEAERVAATKMDNFRGSVEQLRGSLETLLIKGGSPLIEWLRGGVDWLTEATNWAGNFLTGLEDLEGWGGADLSGKIKIGFEDLERQLTEWFNGESQLKLNPWSDLDYGTTGKDSIRSWGEGIGEAAGTALTMFMGVEADGSDSVWVQAGYALLSGFWNKFLEKLKGEWTPLTNEERTQMWTSGMDPVKVEAIAEFNADAADEVQKRMGQLGEESSADYRDEWLKGIAPIPTDTESTIGQVDGNALGTSGGQGYADGFTAAVQARLNNWQLTAQNFFYKADRANGAAIGGGMTDAELMGMLGISAGGPGDTGGLKPQTSAFWGALHGAFPYTDLISGYRANDAYPDHPSGTAIDITVPGMNKAMADAVARWAVNSGRVRYAIWNYQTWWPGGGRTTYSHNAEDPHTDHIHIRTYHQGGEIGGPPGSEVLIHAQAGERVLSQEQNELFKTFVREIGRLADLTRDGLEEQQDFNEEFLAALSSRLDLLTGYVSRESARLSMQRAEFAPGGFDVSEMAAMVGTLTYQIEHLDMAVAEAEAQLNEAKWMKLPQEEVNRLAENLFNLRGEAADARRELEELERIPLEQALDRWANSADNLGRMMDILGEHSNAYELQSGLFPELLGYIGGSYQTNLDLMNTATLPSDIMGYGSAALSDLSSMYGAEQAQLQRALDGTLDSIDASEESWERAWQARADAVEEETDRQRDLLDQQLEDLSDAHRDQLDELNKFYDDKLRTLDDREREITRAEERNRSAKSVAGLEDELRILQGQGYYTEADIARMRQLETQIQEQRDAMVQQDEAWAREDERTRLQRERDEAVASLEQQQEMARIALEDQVEAARKALDAQRETMDREREQQRQHFEDLRRQAEAAHQAELDRVIEKYAALMQEVIDAQNEMLGEAGTYQNAGQTLGQAFADGIMAAIPAIQAAAQAAAEAAAQYLELNSPADKGPLSTLDRWWDAFAPTLYQPLVAQDFMRPVMDTYGPSQGPIVSEEHIYLHADPGANIDMDTLCDLVSRKIGRRVEKAQWGA